MRPAVPFIEAVAAEFEAATGVPVQVELVGFGDIRTSMVQQAPLGEGADVFLGAHDSLGDLVGQPASSPSTSAPAPRIYLVAGLSAFSSGGQLYGLPYPSRPSALYRNTTLVPDAPATFEDLLAVCDELGDDVTSAWPSRPATTPITTTPSSPPPAATSSGTTRPPATTSPTSASTARAPSPASTFFDGLVADGLPRRPVDYGTMTNLFFRAGRPSCGPAPGPCPM